MLTPQASERYNREIDRAGWSLAAILLGMNAVRLIRHMPMSNLTLILGLTALTMGSGLSRGVNPLLLPRLLIIIGVVNLFKTLSHHQIID